MHGPTEGASINGSAHLTRHEHQLNLKLKSGELRRLLFPRDPEESEVRCALCFHAHASTACCK